MSPQSNTKSRAAADCSAVSFVAAAIISSTAKLFDVSARTKLRIRGADRVRYLNGQITNDIGKATPERAIYAAVLNAKGRMDADVFVHEAGDSFLLDADSALRDSLLTRLERYVIADDVEMEDVTDEFALLHLLDSTRTEIRSERFGCTGIDLWIRNAERDAALRDLAQSFEFYDDERAETFRIERGVPRWGFELSNEIIPVEATLESTAIDYAKGCYIGQEVISRMKMSGQTNKRLCGLISLAGVPLAPGVRLTSDEKEAGWITSGTYSSRLGKQIALGFVKRGFNDPGTELLAAGSTVVVAQLPFI